MTILLDLDSTRTILDISGKVIWTMMISTQWTLQVRIFPPLFSRSGSRRQTSQKYHRWKLLKKKTLISLSQDTQAPRNSNSIHIHKLSIATALKLKRLSKYQISNARMDKMVEVSPNKKAESLWVSIPVLLKMMTETWSQLLLRWLTRSSASWTASKSETEVLTLYLI